MSTIASLSPMFLSPVVAVVCPWKTEHVVINKASVVVAVYSKTELVLMRNLLLLHNAEKQSLKAVC